VSRESHNRYIQQAALREAQKALDNNKPGSLSRVSFGQLRIQTVQPWKRILLGAIALIALGSGVVLIYADSFWAGVFVGAAGLGLLLFAAFGRKKTIDALDGVDVIHLAAQLFDAL
jgi:hypothetical protein